MQFQGEGSGKMTILIRYSPVYWSLVHFWFAHVNLSVFLIVKNWIS
jgi:hypothetical protein